MKKGRGIKILSTQNASFHRKANKGTVRSTRYPRRLTCRSFREDSGIKSEEERKKRKKERIRMEMSSILWNTISHKKRTRLYRCAATTRVEFAAEREDTGALMGRVTKISSKKFIMVTRGGERTKSQVRRRV